MMVSILWVLLAAVIGIVWYLLRFNGTTPPIPNSTAIYIILTTAAIVIANELRRPMPKEVYREKYLYPKIPNKFLTDSPKSGNIIFGKDYHTNKTIVSEVGHHTLVSGSTGSGKSATCLLPSILSFDALLVFTVHS